MQPIGNRIVIKPLGIKQEKSGIILPETSSVSREGEVLFVGTKTKDIAPGDKVLYPPNSEQTELEYEGQKVIIIDEGQIICVL